MLLIYAMAIYLPRSIRSIADSNVTPTSTSDSSTLPPLMSHRIAPPVAGVDGTPLGSLSPTLEVFPYH